MTFSVVRRLLAGLDAVDNGYPCAASVNPLPMNLTETVGVTCNGGDEGRHWWR
jgi:hypothetical protein